MPSDEESTTIGIYVGTYISAVLYGLTTLQTFLYFRKNLKDSLLVKLTVLTLWLLDTADSAILPVELYRVDIAKPDQILSGKVYWAVSLSWLLEAIIESIVRMFYCYRIWIVSGGKKLLSGVAIIFATAAMVFGLWLPSKLFTLTPTEQKNYTVITYAFVISAVVADAIIALIMTWLLWASRSNFPQTNSVVNKLILYTVSTGAFTSLVAVIVLITYAASSGLAYVGVRAVVAKMYFNALLATLNQRHNLRHKLENSTDGFQRSLHFTTTTDTELPSPFHHQDDLHELHTIGRTGENLNKELGPKTFEIVHSEPNLNFPQDGMVVQMSHHMLTKQ